MHISTFWTMVAFEFFVIKVRMLLYFTQSCPRWVKGPILDSPSLLSGASDCSGRQQLWPVAHSGFHVDADDDFQTRLGREPDEVSWKVYNMEMK